MARMLHLARPYFVLLAVFAVGRWLLGTRGVPYEKGHHVFSLVILTLMSAFFYGAFTRRWLEFRVLRAMGLGALLALSAQVVIVLLTLLSYALGLQTYFNHPRALGAEGPLTLAQALPVRLGGVVGNTLLSSIAAGLGWALGALLPDERR